MSSYPHPSSAGSTRRLYLGSQDRTPEQESHPADDCSQAIFLGESPAVLHLRSQVERIAPYFRTALVRGEPGSGKRLVAEALHRLGPGAGAPFVVCSAASLRDALSSEPGRAATLLESAEGGTLFLEEVAGLPHGAQAGLLRLLTSREPLRPSRSAAQSGRFGRMGLRGGAARVIASTARDLRTMATMGQLRSDLYARLSAIEILTPSLRDRGDDIALLGSWILARHSRSTGQLLRELSPAAVRSLRERAWPGNLRQLEQVLSRAAALAHTRVLEPEDLPNPAPAAAAPEAETAAQSARPDRLQEVIQQHVLEVLARCGGNKLRAAELLGISRSTLYRMLEAGAGAPPQMDGAA